jgi:thioredoxin reductase
VTDLLPAGPAGFSVLLADGQRLSARRLLVTTGLRDALPDDLGLRDRWARDVLHCPYCHGHEVRDRQLGVLGCTADAVRYAQIVRQWTDDLIYFTPPDTITPDERTQLSAQAIGIVEGTVEQLVIDDTDRLHGVQMHDGCVIPRVALFVPPRFIPNNSLLLGLGCDVDAGGWVTADAGGRTSVPGVWAAGNVVDPRAQVITAAGAGFRCRHRAERRPGRRRRARRRPCPRARGALSNRDDPPEGVSMTTTPPIPIPSSRPAPPGPPTKHQLALMIWLAVFPTLPVLNLTLGHWLATLSPVVRTFVLATIAVPIVIYGLMPQLHRLRLLISMSFLALLGIRYPMRMLPILVFEV